jgi:lipopolysaccharide transport system ATP-binding protein
MFSLRLDHVSKRYLIRQAHVAAAPKGLVAKIRQRFAPAHVFWALRDVSFQVAKGEAVGIIGPNGAGKSTLLKLLAGITAPTSGEISISGKLSALLEVGSGFHPELTGIENIYLSGTILGMQRKEITDKLDDIIDFAGVRPFIDVPVKRYSSGMVVRLGF